MRHKSFTYFAVLIVMAAVLFIGTAAVSSNADELKNADRPEQAGTQPISEETAEILNESGLPVLYINSQTNPGAVRKSRYSEAELKISAEDCETEQLYSGSVYLKLRGNSTSGLAKKPYKLKLETKADLLGMGKSKHWVLLANAIDLTGLRNMLLQSLAEKLGLDSMDSRLVSLVWNGEYLGVYELCEQVRIGKTRVDIYDWEDLAEDVAEALVRSYIDNGALRESDFDGKCEAVEETLKSDYYWVTDPAHAVTFDYLGGDTVRLGDVYDFEEVPDATGGVLMEMDFYTGMNADLLTAYRLPLYMSFPSAGESRFTALEDSMREYVQCMEYAMHATDFFYRNSDAHFENTGAGWYNPRAGQRTGTTYRVSDFSSEQYDNMHYSDFVDVDSVINNMLVCEAADNWDSMKNSFFMYRDTDSRIKFGPVWDFDWAWGNSMYGIDTAGARGNGFEYARQWQTTSEWFANEQYYQTQQFNRLLIRDPYFVVKLYERYHEVREEILSLPDRFIELSALYEKALRYNYARWKGTDSCGGLAGYDYDRQYKNTLQFIRERVEWLDAQFESVETLMDSLGYYVSDDRVKVTSIIRDSESDILISVTADDDQAAGVGFQVNGKHLYEAPLNEGTAVVAVPMDVLADGQGRYSVIQVRLLDRDGKYIKNVYGTEKNVYTNAVSDYAAFRIEDLEAYVPEIESDTQHGEASDDITDVTDKKAPGEVSGGMVILIIGLFGAALFILFRMNARAKNS